MNTKSVDGMKRIQSEICGEEQKIYLKILIVNCSAKLASSFDCSVSESFVKAAENDQITAKTSKAFCPKHWNGLNMFRICSNEVKTAWFNLTPDASKKIRIYILYQSQGLTRKRVEHEELALLNQTIQWADHDDLRQ